MTTKTRESVTLDVIRAIKIQIAGLTPATACMKDNLLRQIAILESRVKQ